MHTVTELGTSVPAFLGKLWKLVEDPETDDLICWAPNGRSFFIRNQAQFARELLPHYYKHNNMASFVRQLNMYGFHKKVSVDLGGLKCDKDEMEFAHQYFCKDHPYLLEHIKRKIASTKSQDPTQAPMKPELMNRMLTEVRTMRGRQEHLDSKLGAMKRENEALWRELAMLRQKHLKQQQIVNKLIHFLVTLVQPSRGGGIAVKRRYPLMIDDPNRQRGKQSKLSKPQPSEMGPVIHELDASEPDVDSEYIVAEMLDGESPERNVDDSQVETVNNLIDDPFELGDDTRLTTSDQVDAKKKRCCKGKKKRKNKAPVKILMPSMENDGQPREETLMLEVPAEESPITTTPLENRPTPAKSFPLATVRSSKLAAMVANMNKDNDFELSFDLESPDDVGEDSTAKENEQALEDIFIIPDAVIDETAEKEEPSDGGGTDADGEKNGNDPYSDARSGNAERENPFDFAANETATPPRETTEESDVAGTSANSKGLSLSRVVGPSEAADAAAAAYRLGSTVEMDNHVETMQTELENLREILRGEGYSIDANTLLGLFGADDPMSFGIPMNPELDPNSHREKEDEEHAGGGELMAYNPSQSLLDFDDDIFLGTSSPVSALRTTAGNNASCNDPLNLEDSKASLLDSLVEASDVNSLQT